MAKSKKLIQKTRFKKKYYTCYQCGKKSTSIIFVKLEHDKVGYICQKCLQKKIGKLYLNNPFQGVHILTKFLSISEVLKMSEKT